MSNNYLDANWKNEMKVRLDFNNMMDKFVGEHGLSEKDIEGLEDKIQKAKKAMVDKRAVGKMDFRDLP